MNHHCALVLALELLATPAVAQVCAEDIVLRAEAGRALTWSEADQNFSQVRLLCAANAEDFSTACADGEVLMANGGAIVCAPAGVGSVTSVALAPPAGVLTVAGSPITTSGTVTLGLASVAANLVAAGPATGASAAWSFRSLVAADIPSLAYLPTSATYAGSASTGGPASSVAGDSVALGTDTTGNYVASVACGSGMSGCVAGAEGATPTLAATLGATVSVSELATATAGDLVTWDASGNPAILGIGATGKILTSNGVGAAPTWESAAPSVTDHGALTGLSDDDHSQYLLLPGRVGGQTLVGGTAAGDDLTLAGTSNGTAGTVLVSSGELRVPASFAGGCSLCVGTTSTGLKDATGAGQLTVRVAGVDVMDYVFGLGLRLLGTGTPSILLGGQGSIGAQSGNRIFFGGGNGLVTYGEGSGGSEQFVGILNGDFTTKSRGFGAYRRVQASTAGSGAPLSLGEDDVGKVITNQGATARVYVQLPAAITGWNITALVVDSDGLRLVASAGDTITVGTSLGPTMSTAGGFCEAVIVGASATIVATDADNYYVTAATGAWTCG